MARTAEFDRAQAVEAAMKLFWSRGYSASSLQQLLDVMGIGRGSFYAAFGDKRTLFIECLDLFYSRTLQILQDAWDAHRSPEVFRAFFYETIIEVPAARVGNGCMMVNTVLELAEVDAGLSTRATRQLAEIEATFAACFQDCQDAARYPATRPATELGASLMLINQGLRVASRKGISRKTLKKTIDTGLATMGLLDAA